MRTAETEIDLLAVAPASDEYIVGECKFRSAPFSYSEYLSTLAKLTPQKEHGKFYYALFSESGFDEKIEEEAAGSDTLRLYTLDDIVNKR